MVIDKTTKTYCLLNGNYLHFYHVIQAYEPVVNSCFHSRHTGPIHLLSDEVFARAQQDNVRQRQLLQSGVGRNIRLFHQL